MRIWLSACLLSLALLSGVLPADAALVEINDGKRAIGKADVTVSSSATLVLAANRNRATLSCTNTHASVHARWGGSEVTAAVGQQLRATASIEIRNTGNIYMISEGADITVSCTEEVR